MLRTWMPWPKRASFIKNLEQGGIIERTFVGQGREADLYVFTRLLKLVS